MIRRHPHVFGTGLDLTAGRDQSTLGKNQAGRKIGKTECRARLGERPPRRYSGCPARLDPRREIASQGFNRGFRLERCRVSSSKKSGRKPAKSKPRSIPGTPPRMAGEIGDLLFTVANLARHVTSRSGGSHPRLPTPSSNGVSVLSRRNWRATAGHRALPHWRRWKLFGMPRRLESQRKPRPSRFLMRIWLRRHETFCGTDSDTLRR